MSDSQWFFRSIRLFKNEHLDCREDQYVLVSNRDAEVHTLVSFIAGSRPETFWVQDGSGNLIKKQRSAAFPSQVMGAALFFSDFVPAGYRIMGCMECGEGARVSTRSPEEILKEIEEYTGRTGNKDD